LDDSDSSPKANLMKEMDKEMNDLLSLVTSLQSSISQEEDDIEKMVIMKMFDFLQIS